jgi:hypothetical protein
LDATTNGRNQKGCIVVFCASNSANHVNDEHGGIYFPSNVTIPGVLTVGASCRNDVQANYSPTSHPDFPLSQYIPEDPNQFIDLVAPSSYAFAFQIPTEAADLWTIDNLDTAGYNPVKTDDYGMPVSWSYLPDSGLNYTAYTGSFSGTSAACPQIAAVAALLLSINPDLTQLEVFNILTSTARKAGPYNYHIRSDCPNGTWSNELGYGVVDASAAVQEVLCYKSVPKTITSSSTWAENKNLLGDLIIDNGATLTITSTVQFAPGAAIIVKPGGKLVLDGATLTNACPDQMWEGIRVEGTTNQRQLAQYQGTIEINNSLIENARVGVSTATYDYDAPNFYSLFGGIVRASNSTFKNSKTSIGFNAYTNHDAAGNIIDNVSYITNCTFVLDDDNILAQNVDASFSSHVVMWDVRGIKIKGCTFKNLTSSNNGRAIYTEDAGFLVDYSCDPNSPISILCGECQNYTRCTFEGFATAIEVGTTGTNYALSIDHSLLKNNQTGVKITGTQNFKVIRSEFDLTKDLLFTNIGLSVSNSSGYKIEQDNFFDNAPCTTPICPNITKRGISINNSGSANNIIYRNQFTKLNYGIYVSSANGNYNPTTGLEFQCNTFNQNKTDFYVISGGTVKPWQGSPTKGADNTFSGTQTSSINSQSSAVITYHHSSGANRTPYNPTTSNVSVVGTAGVNNCASTLCNFIVVAFSANNTLLNQYNSLKNDYNNLLTIAETNQYAQLLQAAQNSPSLNTSLNAELLNNALQNQTQLYATATAMSELSSSAVHTLLSDTVSRLSELKIWFDAMPYPMAKYALAEAFMQTSDYDLAEETLGQMSDWFNFSEEETAEHDNYLSFFNFKKALHNSGRIWPQLTEEEKNELQTIADFSDGRSSQMAQGVLCFFYNICEETASSNDEMPTLNPRSMQQTLPTAEASGDLLIYPNPASDNLILLTGNSEIKIEELFFYDVHGKCVMRSHPGQETADVDISHLPSGFYMVKIKLSTGETVVRKIVKK